MEQQMEYIASFGRQFYIAQQVAPNLVWLTTYFERTTAEAHIDLAPAAKYLPQTETLDAVKRIATSSELHKVFGDCWVGRLIQTGGNNAQV